jgi:hypothetical protein
MNSELNSKFVNTELIVEVLNNLPELSPDPGPDHVRMHLEHDQLLITGLRPLGEKFVSLLFAHQKRNGDLRRLAAQSKSC